MAVKMVYSIAQVNISTQLG